MWTQRHTIITWQRTHSRSLSADCSCPLRLEKSASWRKKERNQSYVIYIHLNQSIKHLVTVSDRDTWVQVKHFSSFFLRIFCERKYSCLPGNTAEIHHNQFLNHIASIASLQNQFFFLSSFFSTSHSEMCSGQITPQILLRFLTWQHVKSPLLVWSHDCESQVKWGFDTLMYAVIRNA